MKTPKYSLKASLFVVLFVLGQHNYAALCPQPLQHKIQQGKAGTNAGLYPHNLNRTFISNPAMFRQTALSNVTVYFNRPVTDLMTLHVAFWNKETFREYFYDIDPTDSGQDVLGTVAAGTYDIQIYDDFGFYYRTYEVGCGHQGSGAAPTFTDVVIDDTCNTITIN